MTDWLARFFLRVVRQDSPVSDPDYAEYLAEREGDVAPSFISYCHGARRGMRIVGCEPMAFANELYDRWKIRCGSVPKVGATPEFHWPAREMPEGAIFISYAREDIQAAQQLVSDLQKGGCIVWLDKERLEAGEDWENTLEKQVKKHCSVFISIISQNTEGEAGYCHLERNWAEERHPKFGKEGKFYVPVIIDGTKKSELRLEHCPKRANVLSLPGGVATEEFVKQMCALRLVNCAGGMK